MAFAGLRKQINKANQYVTEKMGGAEGTKLDMEFTDMERKTDVTVELVEELQVKTKEFLQPNPTARAKMAAVKGISKLSGQAKTNTYPQAEGLLGDAMTLYGKKLGEESIFAQALIEFGDSLKQIADVKYQLDDNVKQNFLEPLHALQMKDLKEVMHHRKKLQGRRLDFDCKRRRQAKGSAITDDEIRGAEEKFAESLQLAQIGMFNLLENDSEQISQLASFAEALLDYHQQCIEILKNLNETMQEKKEESASRPRQEFVPKTLAELHIEGVSDGYNGGRFTSRSYSISSNSSSSSIRNSQYNINNNQSKLYNSNIKNPNHHMYSSQQNLSTATRYTSHNESNTNNNNSNFNRNKIYGSTSNIAILQKNLGSTGFSIPNTNNNNYNNRYQSNSNNPVNMTNIPVDNWLNAWDNPEIQEQQVPHQKPQDTYQQNSRPTVAAKPTFDYNFNSNTVNYQRNHLNNNNNNFNHNSSNFMNLNNSSKPITFPLTPTQIHNKNVQRTGKINDPWAASPLPSPMKSPARTPMPPAPSKPYCTALYDFEPENPGELGFKENDIIQLIQKIDDNWYEGSTGGRTGYFPVSYVQVNVPLP
uniref:Endophilin-A n=1 Tax=Culicoides sonorensis TaxID=179676 RepID=A0A336M0V0_CULSO